MKMHLQRFQEYRGEPVTFDSFDVRFYEQFVHFLTYEIHQYRRKPIIKGLKINTAGKTIKHLKMFLKDRMKKKIIPFFDLSHYKGMEEDVDSVYLSWEEIGTIYHMDLSRHPHLEKHRDLLILGCLTGFRFSDYSTIKPDEIRSGMLYVTQQKTHSTVVVVPLRPDAKAILIDKYQMQMPQVSNPDFNYYIKEVARLAGITDLVKISHKKGNKVSEEVKPKYACVTSHTCRRSFCTNEYLAETPVDLIMGLADIPRKKHFVSISKPKGFRKPYTA